MAQIPFLDRRALMALMAKSGIGAGALASGWPLLAATPWPRNIEANPRFTDYPFALGVASGDPAPDGFVIWTRLCPRPAEQHYGMPRAPMVVSWEVAPDEAFATIIAKGEALASPELGHSVHVEVGGLSPDRVWFYRFRIAGQVSAAGRSRTLPLPGARVDRLRFAVAGCQHYEHGHYTAWAHIAQEPVDFVFHYGDYIYETNEKGAETLTIQGNPFPRARKHNNDEPYSLDDYRQRYAQYKTDPHLQAAHAAAPFWMSLDDHEIDNDWADRWDQDGTPPEVFLYRRAAAFQAYYEHMPLRRAAMPDGSHMQMYRGARYGDLMNAFVLDTRQYRSDQIGEAEKLPGGDKLAPMTPAAYDPARTMMGDAQEQWLFNGLAKSGTRWNLIAHQVMLMHLVGRAGGGAKGFNMDRWSGYMHSRRRLLAHIDKACPGNVVTVSGDAHRHYAGDVVQDEGAPQTDWRAKPGKVITTEFLGTSVSSGDDGMGELNTPQQLADNPVLKATIDRRGYVLCDMGRDLFHADLKVIDRVSSPGGTLSTYASFAVERGHPGMHKA
ncbi:alkaline phosphatase D family protein [Novosphingobium terrae]|uniref:alkaline phosphatase D family protein n=1 Tax=Novosphingobium terrae TaxID=2726189 RepID=UPI00198014DD|nr:alkaline phosphatase D family protein [Novosphingobium terrae]